MTLCFLVSVYTGQVLFLFLIKASPLPIRTSPVSLGFAIAIVTMSQSVGCNRVLDIFIKKNYSPM